MQFRSATVLGLLGLIPFFFFTIFILLHPHNVLAVSGFYHYAAVVLIFLGGIHWGLLAQARSIGQPAALKIYWTWSTVPALVSWIILWLPPLWLGFLVLTIFYVLQYIVDVRLVKLNILPYWLLQLRRILTFLAILCLLVVLIRLWEFSDIIPLSAGFI